MVRVKNNFSHFWLPILERFEVSETYTSVKYSGFVSVTFQKEECIVNTWGYGYIFFSLWREEGLWRERGQESSDVDFFFESPGGLDFLHPLKSMCSEK